ncbi:PsbP domain-containing protein [Pseudoscourfieldia marina]
MSTCSTPLRSAGRSPRGAVRSSGRCARCAPSTRASSVHSDASTQNSGESSHKLPASLNDGGGAGVPLSRRSVLGLGAAAFGASAVVMPGGLVVPPLAWADDEEGGGPAAQPALPFVEPGRPRASVDEFQTVNGFATPPASYGGYGGGAVDGNLVPRYSFLAPKGWKAETITKQQKGYSGVDTLMVDPRDKGNRIYVVTFLREGESNKTFSFTDPTKTLSGLASSDYTLQDAIESADNQDFVKREDDKGRTIYDYDVDSIYGRYLVSMTVDSGRLYALFIKGSAGLFDDTGDQVRTMFEGFKILDADVL